MAGDDLVGQVLAAAAAALGGEDRPGQVRMAGAIASGLADDRHVVVQAGTGTGKSLAYLVPAALAGRRVVVATATKALQDQLIGKDLPLVVEHVAAETGTNVSIAVLKGRSNYLCRQRAGEVLGAGAGQAGFEEVDERFVSRTFSEVKRLVEWGERTETGDRAELDSEPSPSAWSLVSVASTDCPGAARCPSGERCFAEAARARAAEADVVVVNTHLYGAHLAAGGGVLPEHDVVVFDEAHELEDVLSSSLGLELSPGRLRALARTARPLLSGSEEALAGEVDDGGRLLQGVLGPLTGSRIDPREAGIATALEAISGRVDRLLAAVRKTESDDPARARALQAGGHLQGDIAVVLSAGSRQVVWVESQGRDRTPVLRLAPVDVGASLSTVLWPEVTAVLTSATIPPGLPARLGMPEADVDVLDVGSPFDHGEQALLYCAAHLPDPRAPGFRAAAHDELEALIRAAGGRTMALFTSWKAMEEAAAALRDRLPWRVLTQSELPKPALVAAFADDETSCLFATMGFWQGVDVPGRACSLVVLDKLPFPRPDDPLLQARRDLAGPSAFSVVDVPRAATLLAQGAGRLIRTKDDRGVVAVLDKRLASAGYRWDLVRALPPMRRTRHLADVEAFLAPLREGVAGEAEPAAQ